MVNDILEICARLKELAIKIKTNYYLCEDFNKKFYAQFYSEIASIHNDLKDLNGLNDFGDLIEIEKRNK